MSDALRAAFSRDPLTVQADGITYRIPYRPAAPWLALLASANWHMAVFRLVDGAAYEAFMERAEDGQAGAGELARMAHAALTVAAGRPWWEAERLVGTLSDPSLLGAVLRSGVDPETLSLAAFLAVVYSVLVTGQDTAGRMKIDAELSVPPPEAAGDDMDDDMTSVVEAMRRLPGVRAR